jgi:hypothetical protein
MDEERKMKIMIEKLDGQFAGVSNLNLKLSEVQFVFIQILSTG